MEKLFPVPVFFPHSLSLFLSSSSFVRTTHSSFSYCSSLPSSLPPLPPWQPSFTCAESSLAFSLSPLSSRVGSFVRSCFSPAWILFVFCLPLFFSLHSSFVSPRPSRSVSSVPCVPLPPPPYSLSFSVSQPSTYTPCRFVSLVPALFFLFFLFSSFFLSVHARACTRVRCTLRANRSLSRKPLLSQVCSKLDSLPPPGWTVRVFDSTSIVIPEVILGRRTWKLRMAVLENF